MRLERLLAGVPRAETRGPVAGVEIERITYDLADVVPGALHCCILGQRVDGHLLAGAARRAGAVALLCERPLDEPVTQVIVGPGEARSAMAMMAATLAGHPSEHLAVCGVTGTNGKTTVTHLLASVLEAHGMPCRVVGTLGGARTTPEAPLLQELLAAHLRGGGRSVAMEVSSHALVAHRVDGVRFAVGVFTNLSRDHLDFHGSMEAYFQAKALLFDPARTAVGVVNADDPAGRRLLREAAIPMEQFSLSELSEVSFGPGHASFAWEGCRVRLAVPGRISVENALAAAHGARALGIPAATVASGLTSAGVVPGRMERVEAGQPFTVWVDYAHTPDALAAVLEAARSESQGGRVLVVFGAGGERDRTKRPLMGRTAAAAADVAVLTSDNPRGEDPLAIMEEVSAGDPTGRLVRVPDRRAAIEHAVSSARAGDIIVIAGKGHERTQVLGDGVVDFDDRAVAREALCRLGAGR